MAALSVSCLFLFREYLSGDLVMVYNDVGGDTWQQYTAYYASVVNHLRAGTLHCGILPMESELIFFHGFRWIRP